MKNYPPLKGSIMDALLAEYKKLEAELHTSQHDSLRIALRMLEISSKLLSSDD